MRDDSKARRLARLRQLIAGARKIADTDHPLGKRARAELPGLTGLTPEGVELALQNSLETEVTTTELEALLRAAPAVERAHVLLSANVFVGAHRAIALALAAAPEVWVRASRREPLMAELLIEGAPNLFRVVDELTPRPGEHLWAYGGDDMVRSLRAELPAGVILHPHGSGFGVAVVEPRAVTRSLTEVARSLARDVALFDQRGCLSPRWLLVRGTLDETRELAQLLAKELAAIEARIPRGALTPEEAAAAARYRDTMAFTGEVFFAGKGLVGLDVSAPQFPAEASERLRQLLPPTGRHMHVLPAAEPGHLLESFAPQITSVGAEVSDGCRRELEAKLPRARLTRPGRMQRPPFDGPVDRRTDAAGEVL